MIDIKELTDEELTEWCETVSYQAIKNHFLKYPKGYNSLSKSVSTQVAKLSDPDIRKIVQHNKSTKFISETFSFLTNPIINAIKDKISKSVEKGTNAVWATCEALFNSTFHDKIDLYFKIYQTDTERDNVELIKNITNLMMQAGGYAGLENQNHDLVSQREAFEKEIVELKSQISTQHTQICNFKNELENETNSKRLAENSVSDLQKKLELANNEIAELKSEKEVPVDTEHDPKYSKNSAFEYTSVCKVIYNSYKCKNMLRRLADIDENGVIQKFVQEDGPKVFSNRDQLYISDNENVLEGTVAVWDWSASKNDNDSDKDYITSSLNNKAKPIARIKGEFQPQELISLLKCGVPVPKGNRRFMFVTQQGDHYSGVVISEGNYSFSNDLLKISNDVVCLPKYKVSLSSDFIQIDNDMYYRCLDLRNFDGYEYVKDVIETIKDIVVGRATRNAFNKYDVYRKEWSVAKKFIEEIPTDDLLGEIQSKCKCTLKKAKEYLDEFLSCASKYFAGNSEENQALLSAIKSSPDLYEKCEETVKTNWEHQNAEKIAEAKKKLSDFSAKVEHKQLELADIVDELSKKEKLAEDVNKIVAEKIQSAQNDAAEFISKMAFMNPLGSKSLNSTNNSIVVKSGKNIDNAKFENVNSFEDWLDICYSNFAPAGVNNDELSDSLATFMKIACEMKTPMIMSGPNARRIADAFSYSMFGKTAAYVNCMGDFSNDAVEKIVQLPDEIIVIENAFSTTWVNYIMNLINAPTKFYILIQPFSEDLLIEPKGILNYAVPVLTELIVDRIPAPSEYTAPIFGEEFKFIGTSNVVSYSNKYFRELSLCTIAKDRIKRLLGNLSTMKEGNITADFVLGIVPSAYISGNIELIKEALGAEDFESSTKETLRAFLGVENDDTITNS